MESERGSSKRSRAGWIAWWVTLVAVIALVAGGMAYGVRERGWLIDGGQPTITPETLDMFHPRPERPNRDAAAGHESAALDAGLTQRAVAPVADDIPGVVGVAIAELDANDITYETHGGQPMTPASTMKIMTSLAAVHELGDDHQFTTSVTFDGQTVVLVGGGDPLLMSDSDAPGVATIEQLAEDTATLLKRRGETSVAVGYDDSLFTGDTWHVNWPADHRLYVAPVTALAADEGAQSPGLDSPSVDAAQIFADKLAGKGITVSSQAGKVPSTGEVITDARSLPLREIVAHVLEESDNYAAEVLARHVGVARGASPDFAGSAQAIAHTLAEVGVPTDHVSISDGSGLSTDNKLTAVSLVRALQNTAADPTLESVFLGLPVARVNGTMLERFDAEEAQAARGVVHAKTGYLSGITSLAGYTVTADGVTVAFAFIGNDLPDDVNPRPWFDHLAASVSACECAA